MAQADFPFGEDSFRNDVVYGHPSSRLHLHKPLERPECEWMKLLHSTTNSPAVLPGNLSCRERLVLAWKEIQILRVSSLCYA